MKKIVIFTLTILLLLSCFTPVCANEPAISSMAGILIDATTGQVIYEKNQDMVLEPASITKILTIYLGAVSGIDLETKISANEEVIDTVPRDTSNIALDYNEEITLKDALYASQLMSANDASNLIAKGVSGNIKDFVNLMNKTAKGFGARNTNFNNANGLPDDNHYTTAYDFAMITKNALSNELFKKVFCGVDYTIPPTNKNDEERNFVAQHRMVHQVKYTDLGVMGGKSGYTSNALYTLVTYSAKEDKEFICVILKSPDFNSVYDDTQALLEYGYKNFEYDKLDSSEIGEHIDGLTTYTPVGSIRFLLNNDIKKDELVTTFSDGIVTVSTPDGTVLGELETTSETRLSVWGVIWLVIKIVFFILLGLIIALYILVIIASNKSRKRRKERKGNLK